MNLLTPHELCDTLRISRSTLHRLKKRGLPTIGRGRLTRFDQDVVLGWYDQYSHLSQTVPLLPVGDYQCEGCGYEARIEVPMAPGPCPQCGTRQMPKRVNGIG